jgi:hypothetical protein
MSTPSWDQVAKPVAGAGDHPAAVQHRHGVDPVRVPFKGLESLAALHIPHPQRPVIGAGDHPAFWKHGERAAFSWMVDDSDQCSARLGETRFSWTYPGSVRASARLEEALDSCFLPVQESPPKLLA